LSAQRGGPAAGAGASQEAAAVEEAEEEAPPAEIEEAEAVEAEEGEETEDEEEEDEEEEDAPPQPIVLCTTSAAKRCATRQCWLWWLREREPVARGVLRAHVQSCKGPGLPALPVPSPAVRSPPAGGTPTNAVLFAPQSRRPRPRARGASGPPRRMRRRWRQAAARPRALGARAAARRTW